MTLTQIVAALIQRWYVLAASTLLFGVLGLVLILVSAPVYRASIGFRVDPPEGQTSDLGIAAMQTQRVETVVEELHSRSVMEAVVRALGLQVEVTAPAASRFDVLTSARSALNAVGSFQLTRTGNRFAVQNSASGAMLGYATPGTEAMLDKDVAITLAATAIKYPAIRVNVTPEDRRIDELMLHTEVELPNQGALVVRVHHEGRDRELALRLVEAVVAQYAAMHEAMTAILVVVDHAHVGWRPVRPRKSFILALSVMLGLVCGAGLALARAQFSGRDGSG